MPAWQLGKPTGVTVAAHPTRPDDIAVWVPDTHYHKIAVYEWPELDGVLREPDDSDYPTPIFEFGGYGDGEGEFIYPTDVAMIPSDAGPHRVYVSEYGGNDRVSIFEIGPGSDGDAAAEFVGSFGTRRR